MAPVLETKRLCKSFGALTVAQNIDFRLHAGDRHALIGPNGAGKTTFVNMLMGALAPSSGRIYLGGEDVTRVRQAQRVKRGLGRTFQINALFKHLPVLDNVALGIAERRGEAPHMWRPASSHKEVIQESQELLSRLGLADDAGIPVKDLPYGKQRLVEIAIALGLSPKVLLLDEPAAGVPSMESERILKVLDLLPPEIAILIIEHDMDLVFRFAKRITVLVQGEVLTEGPPGEIAHDRRVHQVYLGEQHHA
jgi:ABC-type branched-subunit amino acid transport system ATPase component